jgi:hypothetical protein
VIITQFDDDYQHDVFSDCRKYHPTIDRYTPYQHHLTLRFNSNGRFNKFSARGGKIRCENGFPITFYARPKRLGVSFSSLRGR